MQTVELFLTCGRVAVELVGSAAVAERWRLPSALDGYDVAGLAGHLGRAVLTAESYLIAADADVEAEPVDASMYYDAVLADHDPIDSEFHRTVRARGSETAADGSEALAETMRSSLGRLASRLPTTSPQTRIVALKRTPMLRDEYLKTRLVELVVHIDDLAVSVDSATPELPADAYVAVAEVLAATAARRGGGLLTVRALARPQRQRRVIPAF